MIGIDWFVAVGMVLFVGAIATMVGFGMDITYPQGNAIRKPAIIGFGITWVSTAIGFLVYFSSANHYILYGEWPWYYIFSFFVLFIILAVIATIRLPGQLMLADRMDAVFYQKEKAFWEGRAK